MPEQADPESVEREVTNARTAVQRDIAELGATVRAERDAAKARVQDAAAIAGGAAALGLLIGLGGKKVLKALLAVGVPAAAAYFYVRQQQDGTRDDAEMPIENDLERPSL